MITVKQVVQMFVPFRLEGDDLREFYDALKRLRKTDDLVLELHVSTGASGYGRVSLHGQPVVHEEEGLVVTEAAVEFPAPTGDFGPGEVAGLPVVKGRAKLSMRPPESNGLTEALAGRTTLPDSVNFNGRALEAIRSRDRLSQADLASQINLTGGAIGYWERGVGKPTIANVRALADVLGVGVDKLLTVSRSAS